LALPTTALADELWPESDAFSPPLSLLVDSLKSLSASAPMLRRRRNSATASKLKSAPVEGPLVVMVAETWHFRFSLTNQVQVCRQGPASFHGRTKEPALDPLAHTEKTLCSSIFSADARFPDGVKKISVFFIVLRIKQIH
jgi:hypothetical protein